MRAQVRCNSVVNHTAVFAVADTALYQWVYVMVYKRYTSASDTPFPQRHPRCSQPPIASTLKQIIALHIPFPPSAQSIAHTHLWLPCSVDRGVLNTSDTSFNCPAPALHATA